MLCVLYDIEFHDSQTEFVLYTCLPRTVTPLEFEPLLVMFHGSFELCKLLRVDNGTKF